MVAVGNEVMAERFAAQMLVDRPARDSLEVVRGLLAVQGQDARRARLAIRARSEGLTAADVDRALTVDRSMLITWLNRGTLHLVAQEDYSWLQALTTPQLLAGNARRLAQEGVPPDDAERGVDVVIHALGEFGPLDREALRQRLDAARVRTEGQAIVHLLALASLRGLIVRGPMVGRRHAFVLVREWLSDPDPVDRDVALAELARRYLAGHGPADDRDLAKWAGITLGMARAALRSIESEIRERPDRLVELRVRRPTAGLPPPLLLGAFDPVLLGWSSRAEIVGEHGSVVTSNGLFRPFALVDGRAAGTWTVRGGAVALQPFDTLAPGAAEALDEDARDVARFLAAPAGSD
jgi:hypothetical protein